MLIKLPERLRRFLLQTSVLDELTPRLCAAVTQQPDSAALLEQAAAATGLLLLLDPGHGVYRYHDLLREVLDRQLRCSTTDEEVQDLHRCAAGWYAGAGAIDRALAHYAQANDQAAAAGLVMQCCLPALLRGELQAAERWLSQLPPHLFLQHPRLALDAAWVSITAERMDVEIRLVQVRQALATALPGAAAEHPWQQELLGLEAAAAFIRMDMEAADELSQRGLATIAPDHHLPLSMCAFAQLNLHRYRGPIDKVIQYAELANAAFARAGYIVGQISVQGARTICLYESGQAAQALSGFYELLEFIDMADAGQINETATVRLQCGLLLYQVNRIEEARGQFEAVLTGTPPHPANLNSTRRWPRGRRAFL